MTRCRVAGCERDALRGGYCARHLLTRYTRARDDDVVATVRPSQVAVFLYPTTGIVHAVEGDWTPCGLWLGGYRAHHPRWRELYVARVPIGEVNCRTCLRNLKGGPHDHRD